MEDRALWYARRLHHLYALSFPATTKELTAVCKDRGILIRVAPPTFGRLGVYLTGPERMIVLRQGVGRAVLAHELIHDLAREGDPERGLCEEKVANRFAWLLCSGKAEARQLLGISMDMGPGIARHEKQLPGPSLGTKAMVVGTAVTYAWTDRAPQAIEQQVRACRWYARQQGLSLGPAFVDHCTAFRPTDQRPEAARLLSQAQTLRASGVVAVLVANLSRLAPCRALSQPFLEGLSAAGLTVQSADARQWSVPWR